MLAKVWRERNPPVLIMEMQIGTVTMDNRMEVYSKQNKTKSYFMILESQDWVYNGRKL